MNKPHFELILVSKSHGNVIEKLEKKLRMQEGLRQEVSAILAREKIVPTKIYITKVDEGKGSQKINDMFEGFSWRKYWGKVRGEKRGFFRDSAWKNDFYIYTLYGKNKNGIMFTTDSETSKEIKRIGNGIYERILRSICKEGPLPLHAIKRIGTIS